MRWDREEEVEEECSRDWFHAAMMATLSKLAAELMMVFLERGGKGEGKEGRWRLKLQTCNVPKRVGSGSDGSFHTHEVWGCLTAVPIGWPIFTLDA